MLDPDPDEMNADPQPCLYQSVVPGPGHGELEHILLRHVLGPTGQRLLQQHCRRQQPHRDPAQRRYKRGEETIEYIKGWSSPAQRFGHNPLICVTGVHH
jgi:hypothetical protein